MIESSLTPREKQAIQVQKIALAALIACILVATVGALVDFSRLFPAVILNCIAVWAFFRDANSLESLKGKICFRRCLDTVLVIATTGQHPLLTIAVAAFGIFQSIQLYRAQRDESIIRWWFAL